MNAYREKMAQAKKDPIAELPVKPTAEFLLLGDCTQEALVKTLAESPRGGAILSDELTGWIGSHDKYSKGGNDRQAYLSLWSSLPLSVHRKLDGVATVALPVLSVLGGLTPSSLPRLHGGQEDGFLSRFLIACPEERQATYTKQGITAAQALAYGAFIRKLWELAPEHQDEHGITPKTIVLSEEAEEIFEAFYNEMQQALSGDAIPGVMRGTFSKAPAQVARIALVLHCARNVSEEESDTNFSGHRYRWWNRSWQLYPWQVFRPLLMLLRAIKRKLLCYFGFRAAPVILICGTLNPMPLQKCVAHFPPFRPPYRE
jgi:hypothetical protein